jgi:S-adenosylmethionine/arginine decarboxylase-like enzyme
MTHILLNIEYNDLLPILKDENLGEKMIMEWCNHNNHTLVKRPDMHVFPSTYVEKKDKGKSWDIQGLMSYGMGDNFSYIGYNENDVVRHHSFHGYTGVGILKESHISIHTYPEQNSMHVDFFSCKQLDRAHNTNFMNRYFEKQKANKFKVQFINRQL